MYKVNLTKKSEVYNYCKPYIIAELGSNHNGDMELAKKLIFQAKQAGADCVKFQSWSKDSIFSKKTYEDNYFVADDYRNRTDYTLEQIVEEYSISEDELLQMKAYADELEIDCTSTPFSPKEADFLVDKLKTPFIKVASMDLNNYPFLEYLAKKGLPMVISTGLSELYEIDKAVRVIEEAGNRQIIILHCVSIYPPQDKQVHLNNILTLQRQYPEYPIGFSDHTLGISIPLASVALGVCLIEKHFTLDKNMEGWDHKVSANFEEMAAIAHESKRIAEAMGSFRINCIEDEERRLSFRRSIVLKNDIKAGQQIEVDMIDFKRPGTGIEPGSVRTIIGRTAKKDIPADKPFGLTDLI
ncbi:MAG: N-acetylneuraminate synthase family protein [Chitinophagales bacterium]|nr:N-acetylneuraminate synthase family protein [Chitinophagales bacterium]